MKVKLTYFKAWNGPGGLGGKYYSEGELESEHKHYFKVVDEVERLRDERRLPGLVDGHDTFHVLVETVPESVPHLLVAPHPKDPTADAGEIEAPHRPGKFAGTLFDAIASDPTESSPPMYALKYVGSVRDGKPWLKLLGDTTADWSSTRKQAGQFTAEEATKLSRLWDPNLVIVPVSATIPATEIEARCGIRGADLTSEERAAVDRIKGAFHLLSARERSGSPTDIITDLGPAIAAELRRVSCEKAKSDAEPEEIAGLSNAGEGSAAESVDHPRHYNAHPSGVECIDIVEHMTFCAGNAVKYLWRAGLKTEDPTEDLKKGAWYARREVERVEKVAKKGGKKS